MNLIERFLRRLRGGMRMEFEHSGSSDGSIW